MPDRLPKSNVSLQKPDPILKNYAQAVHDGMASVAGLAAFPTPPESLASFQTSINTFATAITNAIDLGKKNTTAKAAARVDVENTMRLLSRYVSQQAQANGITYDGMRAIVAISGFEVSVVPTPVGDIPVPTIKVAQSVAPGQLHFILIFSKKVKSVVVEYKLPADTNFKTYISTSTRGDLTGLTSGSTYQIRFRGVGIKGTAENWTTLDNYVII